ncbi:MAG: HAMP domain-containing histidine kinase [Candidatus Riflebacteria bacterium]|nr:HAMP domain-containing histidine kinase [Candidatus Riflebacteria bacterium]
MRKLIFPQSLFGRLFISMIGVSFCMIIACGMIMFHRTREILEDEANERLITSARILAAELGTDNENLSEISDDIFGNVFGKGKGLGWIRNAYLADLRHGKPELLTILTFQASDSSFLIPPIPEDVEDMLDESLTTLESGSPVFPDPDLLGVNRQFKILLFPVLDSDKNLNAVIGLEADLLYLGLSRRFTSSVWEIVLAAITVSLITSAIMARNFFRKFEFLLVQLAKVAKREEIEYKSLNIRELDQLQTGLIESGKAIKEFYETKMSELSFTGAALAHEIRNPLASVEMHFALLKRKFPTDITASESAVEVQNGLNSLKRLISIFLDYSRLVTPCKSSFLLSELVQEISEEYLKRTAVPFEYQCRMPDNFHIYADRELFRRIISNLLDNSIKFRETGLSVLFEAESTESRTTITVSDNGPGVSDEMIEKLFTPFASDDKSGYGIGLALVRKFIESHLGKISYHKSAQSTGANFVIEIPNMNSIL